MSVWPEGRRCAISVGFDNLGEASEIELGLRPADGPMGDHYSVTDALPVVLEELGATALSATFFVEGLNAEVYPDVLRSLSGAGHEVAFHAWRHEEWSQLGVDAERANLARGLAALRELGIEVKGFRPPGGLISDATTGLLAAEGVTYCSPAGSSAGVDGSVAVLPFAWPAVDVFHVLPVFAALRQAITGNEDAGGPQEAQVQLLAAIDAALERGGHVCLGLHTWIAEFERDQLRTVLARVAQLRDSGEAWVARHDDVATWVLAHPENFPSPPVLDRRSWMTGLEGCDVDQPRQPVLAARRDDRGVRVQ